MNTNREECNKMEKKRVKMYFIYGEGNTTVFSSLPEEGKSSTQSRRGIRVQF